MRESKQYPAHISEHIAPANFRKKKYIYILNEQNRKLAMGKVNESATPASQWQRKSDFMHRETDQPHACIGETREKN